MDTLLRVVLVIVGLIGLFVYFRSVVRVTLLNRRERDALSRAACFLAVSSIQRFTADRRDYVDIQRSQAWILPLFILLSIVSWFLLVQISFGFILWGLKAEASLPYALSASGSALSTLGFKTPPTLLGEFLAIFEAAIGLVIVVLLFSFAPGYLAAVRTRERKVGWLYARTGHNPTCASLVTALEQADKVADTAVWEDWEAWFRGILETHSISPILAYAPSIYRGTNWVGAAAAVLDSASLVIATLDLRQVNAAHICRHTGIAALNLISNELPVILPKAKSEQGGQAAIDFDKLYETLAASGLPVDSDKEKCRQAFASLRAEYEPSLLRISASTRMPIHR
ncbi:hypothetical protein [Aminobacter sp. HY435]|uniref:hypothetical protein n=1 Tax=Aminobacter sp. HY435 TaxID=2970917 RepID=UPI0022B99AD9|nr:hypothetical protein [Aminobacter sp. HY435]